MKIVTPVFCVIALLFSCGICEAALFIDDVYTTTKGKPEIEFSYDYSKDLEKEFNPDTEEYDKTVSKEQVITTLLSFGLTDNWDVTAVFPYKFLDGNSGSNHDGFDDIIIDTKYRFFEEKSIFPSFAIDIALKTDSGNDEKGLGTGKKNLSINNIFTKTLRENIFDLNLGYTFTEGKTDDIFFYSFDFARDITEKLNVVNEIYGETTFKGDFDENIFIYALSASYAFSEMISLEVGTAAGLSKASPDIQFSSTLTLSF